MAFISEISAAASTSCSLPFDVSHFPTRVEMVSNSVSRRLLYKFRDVSEVLEFDYLPSRLWSPPLQPSMFLNTPGNSIVTPNDMLLRLRKLAQSHQRRRYGACFNAFWCFAKRSRCSSGSNRNSKMRVPVIKGVRTR